MKFLHDVDMSPGGTVTIKQIRESFKMLMQIYSVFDVASGAYMRPFFCQQDGEATRMFSDLCTDAEHPMGKHPKDYSLFRLGSFNDQSALIEGTSPECLCQGLEMVALKRNNGDA